MKKSKNHHMVMKPVHVRSLEKGDFIFLEWLDTVSRDSWQELEDAKKLACYSIYNVGWILAIHSDRIIMSDEIGEHQAVHGSQAIPKVNIKKVFKIGRLSFDLDHGPPNYYFGMPHSRL